MELLFGNMLLWDLGVYNLTWQMVVCGLGVQISKCGIVSCKYVTVGDGTLKFDMANIVVWSGDIEI